MSHDQCQQVIDYMRRHGSITKAQAMNELGVWNLPGRIYDIQRHPFCLNVFPESTGGTNRHGKKTRFTTYRLDAPTPERELVAAPTQRELGPTPGVEAQLELLQVRAQMGPREA